MPEYDVVIVGSGINSLVCAAALSMRGRKVLVLEREPVAGGCIRTGEATLPGYRHDLFAMSYPLFVTTPFYPDLEPELARRGVRMLPATVPTGVALPDGRSLLLRQSRTENVAAFDRCSPGDGAAFDAAMRSVEQDSRLIFGMLGGSPASPSTLRLLAAQIFRRRIDGMASFGAASLEPMRDWLERSFASDVVQALIAPWILHVGLAPEASLSALMSRVILFTLEAAGIPFVEGGGARLVEAFAAVIRAAGGDVLTGCDVATVLVNRGRARGVITSDGIIFDARRAVVCNVTPDQLYGRLLPASSGSRRPTETPPHRYGLADMQIHVALHEPPEWRDPELREVGLLHLTSGLDGVSRAVGEATRGLLPAEPTIVVGQPAGADPSRCPPGTSLLWIQLQELPRMIKGDVAGVVTTGDGAWTDEVAAAYSARVLTRLRQHIVNFDTAAAKVTVMGPHVLEAHNVNLVGGDPYSGACTIDQFHLLRSGISRGGPRTSINGLYHIGASTHPGPGLSGTSGHLAAQAIG